MRAADSLGGDFWPGWSTAPFAVLLVSDSVEFLLAHPAPSSDFTPTGERFRDADVLHRPRVFPAHLQATMPAVGGVATIVIGTLANTGLSAARWTVVLLHEHFHQVQMSRPGYFAGVEALGLSGGDATGMWMLNYPFPYADARVNTALDTYRSLLHAAVEMHGDSARSALRACDQARNGLYATLTPADGRYLALQVWQEGFSRSVEHRGFMRLAARGWNWSAECGSTEPVSYPASTTHAQCRAELVDLIGATDQRICFYAIGWA